MENLGKHIQKSSSTMVVQQYHTLGILGYVQDKGAQVTFLVLKFGQAYFLGQSYVQLLFGS